MTGPGKVVIRQLVTTGETLLLALEPIEDAEFFAENPDGFSAAWVVGHLACVADLFSSWFGAGLLLEPAFHATFNETAAIVPGLVSKAGSVDPEKYPKALLLHLFCEAMIKAQRVLRAFGDEAWGDPAPRGAPVSLTAGGAVWEKLALHTAWHCGQLAGSMPRFAGTYALNILPHHLYDPEQEA